MNRPYDKFRSQAYRITTQTDDPVSFKTLAREDRSAWMLAGGTLTLIAVFRALGWI